MLKLINKCDSPLLVRIQISEIYEGFRTSFDKFAEDLSIVKKEKVKSAPFDTDLFYVKKTAEDLNILTSYGSDDLLLNMVKDYESRDS